MKLKRLFVIGIAACILVIGAVGHSADWWPFSKKEGESQNETITEIKWEDLVPDDFVPPENPFNSLTAEEAEKLMDGSDESNARLAEIHELLEYAPVVDELDGKRIKLAAYITPLEFDGQTRFSEFLLVPYVGACMHSPPPPANQIVHANSPAVIEVNSVYEPVWAIGTIHTESVASNLAESGYRLDVEEVLPYLTQ